MTERPLTLRVRTAGELVASLPSFLRYQPSPGDVAFTVCNNAGRQTVTGNIPHVPGEDAARAADQVARAAHSSGGDVIFIVGYAPEGQAQAEALRDALRGRVETINTFAVVNGKVAELAAEGSTVARWDDLPDPPVTLVARLGSPAPSRDTLSNDALPLPSQQVPEATSAQAHAALREATGPVSMYADEAMALLARCGPGSPASTRATFAALIARDVKVRDAVLVDVVNSGDDVRSNLRYTARTAAAPDVQNLCTLAGTALALEGTQQPLAEAFLERGGDLPLARLARMTIQSGINPERVRAELAAVEAETRTSQLRPMSEVEAARGAAQALTRDFAPGLADPTGPVRGRNGPTGPGL